MAIHAYFDDSATLNSGGLMLLAGFATSDTNWDAFATEWRERLSRHAMSRLHTSDFLSGKAEYKNPDLDYDGRVEILKDFVFLVRKYVHLAVAIGVDASAFKKIYGDTKTNVSTFLCHRVTRRTLDHVETWVNGLPMVLAFDQSPQSVPFHSAMYALMGKKKRVRDNVAGFSFVNSRMAPSLQAADLLACLTVREFRKGNKGWQGTPFLDLFFTLDEPRKQIPFVSELWDEEELLSPKYSEAAE